MTLSVTVLHGGSPLTAGDETETELIAEPSANPTVTQPPQQLPPTTSIAPLSEPGQAVPWTPGATPRWSSPLKDLPVRRAPVLDNTPHSDPAAPAASAAISTTPTGSETSAAAPTASQSGAAAAHTGTTEATPQAANPERGPVDGLLGSVVDATKGISR